jgi:NitT/TauT family transport system ATP-binding protein
VNGNAIGVSPALAARMEPTAFGEAGAAGRALLAAAERSPIRIGVPFPFSMHMELLRYWIDGCGRAPEGAIQVRTVPPPMMAEALSAGDIDAFCVGEPWGSDAVDRGLARLILPGRAIWAFAPEKVLAARTGWAEGEPAVAGGLMRALHRAAAWLSDPGNLSTASDVLARPDVLDLPAEVVERALRGRIVSGADGARHDVPGFLELHRGAAAFPWRSQGAWIADRLARRHGLDPVAAQAAGRRVFRSDLYRLHLGALAPDLPGASEKLEGAMQAPTPVASRRGALTLSPDAFFDGAIFEPIESQR